MNELDFIVEDGKIFFLTHPPEKLRQLLKQLGLEFEERIIYCG